MELFIIGIVVAANLIFILFKYEQKRYSDATLDLGLLVVVTFVFMGSYAGLVVGTVASLIISIYLYYKPPSLPPIGKPSNLQNLSRDDVTEAVLAMKAKVDNARKSI